MKKYKEGGGSDDATEYFSTQRYLKDPTWNLDNYIDKKRVKKKEAPGKNLWHVGNRCSNFGQDSQTALSWPGCLASLNCQVLFYAYVSYLNHLGPPKPTPDARQVNFCAQAAGI